MLEKEIVNLMRQSLCGTAALDITTKKIFISKSGLKDIECYKAICGRDAPCKHCPEIGGYRQEVYNHDERKWMDVHCQPVDWIDGRKVFLIHYIDITKEKELEKQLEKQCFVDELTGIKNSYSLKTFLDENVDEDLLVIFEMNFYKYWENLLSPEQMKHMINYFLDLIKPFGDAYRLEENKFVLVIKDFAVQKIQENAAKIMNVFCKTSFGGAYHGLSCGIGNSLDEAESALYYSKHQQGTVVMFDKELKDDLEMESKLARCLMEDIQGGCSNFKLLYQPIIDLSRQSIHSAEALLRFHHPCLGHISPAKFIPVCEQLRLISPLGDWVMEQAMRFCKHINSAGHPDFKIQINISAIQMDDMELTGRIYDALRKTDVDPQNVIFEITESTLVNRIDFVRLVMNGIKDMGCRFALDDFGTGESSLAMLWELPFDIIKIDSSFIADTKAQGELYIGLITDLAHDMGCQVCIEGVETLDQLKLAKRVEIDTVQGFFYSKPLDAADFGGVKIDTNTYA